jgi:hypothetical protein
MRQTLKRLLVAGAVVASTTVLVAGPSDAAKKPASIPPCADIVDANHAMTWDPVAQTATSTLTVLLAAPACDNVTYTYSVDSKDGATASTTDYTSDGTTIILTISDLADPDNCVLGSVATSGTTKKGAAVPYETGPSPAEHGYVDDPAYTDPTGSLTPSVIPLGCGTNPTGAWG